MYSAYSTQPITEDRINLAFILVDASGRGIGQGEWSSFCKKVITQRAITGLGDDVVVATDVEGHVKGVFVAEIIESPLFGRVLHVPLFLTASAGDEDGVIVELVDAARKKARMAHCTDVRIWSTGGESWIRATEGNPALRRYAGLQLKTG